MLIALTIVVVTLLICTTAIVNRRFEHYEKLTELEYNHEWRMYALGVERTTEANVIELGEVALELAEDEEMYEDQTEDDPEDPETGPDLGEGDDYKE